MCGRKPWKKWTAMYWFAHKVCSAVMRGWIRQCMKRFENWWLSASEIPLGGNSLHVSPIFLYVSSCFTYCFPSFLGYFPCFPRCFSLFPILDLTSFRHASEWVLFIESYNRNQTLFITHFTVMLNNVLFTMTAEIKACFNFGVTTTFGDVNFILQSHELQTFETSIKMATQ